MTRYPRMTDQDFLILEQRMNPAPNTFSTDTPDPGPESNLLRECMKYCRDNGYPCWHDRSKKVNEPGWPDLIIFLPGGHVILIELKSAKGVFRKKQQLLARQFMYLKHRYYKIRSFKKFLAIPEFNVKAKNRCSLCQGTGRMPGYIDVEEYYKD